MEIASRTVIPYDIDPFGEEGCRGTDWWSDRYGTKVTLLTSASGSAYVCPEKPGEGWRAFVDAEGVSALFKGTWPADRAGDVWWRNGATSMRRVLACAARERSGPASAELSSRLRDTFPRQVFPGMTERKEPDGRWRWWHVALGNESTHVWTSNRYWSVGPHSIVEWIDGPGCDPTPPSTCPNVPLRIPDESLRSLMLFLESAWESSNQQDRRILSSTISQVERAVERMEEIEAFENACYPRK
jgi:hypothetical protein